MRILLVSDSFAPRLDGVAIAVWREAQRFLADGHEVGILALSADEVQAREQVAGRAELFLVKPWFEASSGYPTRLFNKAMARRTIASFKPDLVRIHTIGPLGCEGLLRAREADLRIEMFWHTDLRYYARSYRGTSTYLASRLARVKPRLYLNLLRGPTAFYRETLRYLLQSVSHIDVPSRKSENEVRWFGYTGPVTIRPTPAAIVDEPLPHDHQVPQGRVLYVGRVSREKNISLLLRAFERLATSRPGAELVVAGPEGDKRTTKQLRTWLGRNSAVSKWIGGIPRTELAKLMATADVVAIPSLSETQCLVIGEARSVGAPVVMVDSELHLSYADDPGVHLTDPNPAALAASILELLEAGDR